VWLAASLEAINRGGGVGGNASTARGREGWGGGGG